MMSQVKNNLINTLRSYMPMDCVAMIVDYLNTDPINFIEIGARRGGKQLHNISRFVNYYGFEPNFTDANALEESLRRLNLYANVNVYTDALMDEQKKIKIYGLRHKACSSVLKPNRELMRRYSYRRNDIRRFIEHFDVLRTYECNAITLDQFSYTKNIRHFDFIQIDTQGTEHEIFKGGKHIISNGTLMIHVEMEIIPMYKKQHLIQDMLTLLKEYGFRLIFLENFQYVSRDPANADDIIDRGELLSVDGYFCREIDDRFMQQIRHDKTIVLRYMLMLYSIGFKTLAVDIGKQYLTNVDSSDKPIAVLAGALTKLYCHQNKKAHTITRTSILKFKTSALRFKRYIYKLLKFLK